MHKYLQVIILCCFLFTAGNAQTPFTSESLIKYDLTTHKTNKVIPFDKSFTLVIKKFQGGKVTDVHLYEAHIVNGNRLLVENIYKTTPGVNNCYCKTKKNKNFYRSNVTSGAIIDKALRFKEDTNSLMIYVDPLKPNKLFDINVISNLSTANKAIVHRINSSLQKDNTTKAKKAFEELKKKLTDQIIARTYLSLDFEGYKRFYKDSLASIYNFFADIAHFPVVDFLTLNELQAIDISCNKEKQDFKDAHFLVEAISNNYGNNIQRGLIEIYKVYQKEEKTDLPSGQTRMLHIKSNLKYFDSLHQKSTWLIGKGYKQVVVGRNIINMDSVRLKIKSIRESMTSNLLLLTEKMDAVSKLIDKNKAIKQGTYLAAQTISSDLKTAGGSVLFIDAGFSNILAPGLNDTRVYIPRLYSGVSIYFRPIDKNTRRNTFPSKFEPEKDCGCKADGTCGPDYGAISKASAWQHLSLNIGITWGAIPNKDFENFYNNTSLLIGPAYRFKRAFKISVGLAFLKRSSENPLISEKKVLIGQYVALSVDIDFIQTVKDVTSILFK